MSAVPAKVRLEALLERFGGAVRRLESPPEAPASPSRGAPFRSPALPTGLALLDGLLADGGLPLEVSVLASPKGVGGAGELAARVLAQLHASRSCLVAWVDPSQSLFAPGLARRGVDLGHLVVVRPTHEDRAMAALELVSSGVFAAVVVDADDPWGSANLEADADDRGTSERVHPASRGVRAGDPETGAYGAHGKTDRGTRNDGPGSRSSLVNTLSERVHPPEARAAQRRALAQEERFVRRLGEASKKTGTAVLLSVDETRRRSAPLPAALRLACAMRSLDTLEVRLEHDRRGTPPTKLTVPLSPGAGETPAPRRSALPALHGPR